MMNPGTQVRSASHSERKTRYTTSHNRFRANRWPRPAFRLHACGHCCGDLFLDPSDGGEWRCLQCARSVPYSPAPEPPYESPRVAAARSLKDSNLALSVR